MIENGNTRNVLKLVDDWLEIAYTDIEVAQLCYQNSYYLYMAFLCQQSIEKAIKAVIESSNVPPKPIHNLELLAREANIWDMLDEKQKDFLLRLRNFAVAARYPRYKEKMNKSLSRTTAQKILSGSKEMLLWLCRYLRKA